MTQIVESCGMPPAMGDMLTNQVILEVALAVVVRVQQLLLIAPRLQLLCKYLWKLVLLLVQLQLYDPKHLAVCLS